MFLESRQQNFNVLVCTVLKQGELLRKEVLSGISGYDLLCMSSLPESYTDRQLCINRNWRRLQETIRDDLPKYAKYNFVLLIDSDVVIPEGSIEKLAEFAKKGESPCIDTHDGKGEHIITSCVISELYDFLEIDYSQSCCPCNLFKNPFYIKNVVGYEIKR